MEAPVPAPKVKGDGWLEELAEGPALKVGAEAPNWKAPPADADENPPNVSFSFAAPVPPASVAEKENGEGVTAAAPVDGADDPKAKTGALDLAAGSAGSAGLLATLSPADPKPKAVGCFGAAAAAPKAKGEASLALVAASLGSSVAAGAGVAPKVKTAFLAAGASSSDLRLFFAAEGSAGLLPNEKEGVLEPAMLPPAAPKVKGWGLKGVLSFSFSGSSDTPAGLADPKVKGLAAGLTSSFWGAGLGAEPKEKMSVAFFAKGGSAGLLPKEKEGVLEPAMLPPAAPKVKGLAAASSAAPLAAGVPKLKVGTPGLAASRAGAGFLAFSISSATAATALSFCFLLDARNDEGHFFIAGGASCSSCSSSSSAGSGSAAALTAVVFASLSSPDPASAPPKAKVLPEGLTSPGADSTALASLFSDSVSSLSPKE